MYLAVVVLTMFALPVGSTLVDHLLHPDAAFVSLIGRWFVFWSVGVRLALAGARQTIQPAFTAREIFHVGDDEALPIVRELGVANLGVGVVGLLSLVAPSFVLPAALCAAIFYGAAAVGHVWRRDRSANETVAMASDLFVFVVLAIFVAAEAAGAAG
jgi:NADPH-dependent ferric siderophore reductase